MALMHLSLNPLVNFGRGLHGDEQLPSVLFMCCTSICHCDITSYYYFICLSFLIFIEIYLILATQLTMNRKKMKRKRQERISTTGEDVIICLFICVFPTIFFNYSAIHVASQPVIHCSEYIIHDFKAMVGLTQYRRVFRIVCMNQGLIKVVICPSGK